jgi:hypothetical protein
LKFETSERSSSHCSSAMATTAPGMAHPSNHSWLDCIDQSPAAAAVYARAVYGATSGAESFNWSSALVLFPWFLKRRNATTLREMEQCIMRDDRVYKKTLMEAVWVNYRSQRDTGHVPFTNFINRGGKRQPCQRTRWGCRQPCKPAEWGWVEVMHTPSVSESRWYQASWTNQLWFYKTPGSGLWYNARQNAALRRHG